MSAPVLLVSTAVSHRAPVGALWIRVPLTTAPAAALHLQLPPMEPTPRSRSRLKDLLSAPVLPTHPLYPLFKHRGAAQEMGCTLKHFPCFRLFYGQLCFGQIVNIYLLKDTSFKTDYVCSGISDRSIVLGRQAYDINLAVLSSLGHHGHPRPPTNCWGAVQFITIH